MTRRVRPAMHGAILASVLVHALALLTFVEVSRDQQAALVVPAEQPEQTAIEVEILADPRTGLADDGDSVQAEQTAMPPTEPPREQATAHAEPPDPADQQSPAEQAEAPSIPPPPDEPPHQTAPPAPPRTAAAPPVRTAPPNHPRAGSGTIGRADGTTDIVLGANTVPAGLDPSQFNMPPRYPREASQRGQQGIVRLSVIVATDGSALSVEVAQSSGYPMLDRAARDAVAKWRFRPGQDGGLAVPSTIPVTLSFILDERR